MLSWLGGWFDRFGGAVDSTVLRMVRWVVHALASVVYTVFSHVGRAWDDMYAAGNWIRRTAWQFGEAVYRHLRTIVLHDIPKLFHWAEARLRSLEHWVLAWLHRLLADLAKLRVAVLGWITALYRWAWQHIYVPLFGFAKWLEQLLRKWAYTAWWYVTHPAALAGLLFWPLIKALEDNAWQAARVLGTFLTALVLANVRRVVALAEEIIAAVL